MVLYKSPLKKMSFVSSIVLSKRQWFWFSDKTKSVGKFRLLHKYKLIKTDLYY